MIVSTQSTLSSKIRYVGVVIKLVTRRGANQARMIATGCMQEVEKHRMSHNRAAARTLPVGAIKTLRTCRPNVISSTTVRAPLEPEGCEPSLCRASNVITCSDPIAPL